MSVSHFTIHRLKDGVDWSELVERFNDEKNEEKQYVMKENHEDSHFTHITDYALYICSAQTPTQWAKTLDPLVLVFLKIEKSESLVV